MQLPDPTFQTENPPLHPKRNGRPLTKRDVVRRFNQDVRPEVVKAHGVSDKPAMREAWNNYVDWLEKSGLVTADAHNWSSPCP